MNSLIRNIVSWIWICTNFLSDVLIIYISACVCMYLSACVRDGEKYEPLLYFLQIPAPYYLLLDTNQFLTVNKIIWFFKKAKKSNCSFSVCTKYHRQTLKQILKILKHHSMYLKKSFSKKNYNCCWLCI